MSQTFAIVEEDCTTGCVLHYTYFKEHYKMTVISFINQQVPNADPKAIHNINFT